MIIPAALQPLANHLWQSTVFALAAGGLAFALRKNRAAVRYWLWLAASLKFLIPFSLLVSIGGLLEWPAAPAIAPPPLALVQQIAQPFAPAIRASWLAAPPVTSSALPTALLIVWLGGAVVVCLGWQRAWQRLRTAMRAAWPLDVSLYLAGTSARVMCSPALVEPCAIGILRPAVLLPDGIRKSLTPEQLHAILLHELCHIRRRDNLTGAFHLIVETVFWFFPPVWWIGRRLLDERELACDQEVLRVTQQPEIYAQSIINVCRFCLGPSLICASGVTGSNLARRIEQIMINRVARRLSVSRVVMLAAVALTAVAGPIAVGVMHAQPRSAQVPPTPQRSFEVVSVKAAGAAGGAAQFGAGCDGSFPRIENHRFEVTTTVYALITWAYGFNVQGGCSYVNYGGLLSGGPGWIRSERFEVKALMPDGSPTYSTSQFLNGAAPELEAMIRSMLQDRFKLVLHRQKKDVSGYVLVVGKGAPTVPAAKADDREAFFVRNQRNPDGLVSAHLVASKTTMRYVALTLGLMTRRMVEDRTGLAGEYTFDLEFAPPDAGAGESSAPSLFTAVQEKLGLKLDAAKVSAEGLVIDSAARPSDN